MSVCVCVCVTAIAPLLNDECVWRKISWYSKLHTHTPDIYIHRHPMHTHTHVHTHVHTHTSDKHTNTGSLALTGRNAICRTNQCYFQDPHHILHTINISSDVVPGACKRERERLCVCVWNRAGCVYKCTVWNPVGSEIGRASCRERV